MIEKGSFYKNPFIGLFLRSCDTLTLVPKNAPEKLVRQVERVLGTKTLELYVDQASILGIFASLNDTGCVLPSFAEPEEKKRLKQAGWNVCTITERFCPGNNVLVNNKSALVNPRLPKEDQKTIADALNVEVFSQQVSPMPTVGSIHVVTNRGILAYNDSSEEELKLLERFFQVPAGIGTANLGSPFISLGVVANAKGALVGSLTSGFEVQRVYEALFA
ncbi:translation initiation factor IF-6 [Candidatus Micrarchaeota archaeon]|nr:translation initiation factor IF-6 [Candidatus Micrarchaeota archaeon]